MLAQIEGFGITSPDELAISPAQFIDFLNTASDCVHPIGAIYTSTVQLLRYSFWLAEQKATLPRKEYKELLSQLNWEGEEKAYLKVKAAFDTFTPYELAQVEPRTIFQIALNFKKYQSVIPQMKGVPQITQDLVRSFMKNCYKARAKREEQEEQVPSIWLRMPHRGSVTGKGNDFISYYQFLSGFLVGDNKRACQIGPIYNQFVGVMLEEMMTTEGRTAQSIVEEALVARYEFKYGFSTASSFVANNVTQEVETTQDSAPIDKDVETAPDLVCNQVTINKYESWDADQVSVEEDLNEETLDYQHDYDEDEDSQDSWSFEPEEKDDLIEDYEMLTPVVEVTSQISAPVDLLVQNLQTANSWQEINEVLTNNEEYKQAAWDALTREERRRITELTPEAIQRLSNAKRKGLIIDFREVREGVYQVKRNGCLFWEVVYDYKMEEFFARL
ncbi:hypothetical protein RIVM261_024810 [Rivularia sp. IAM M-261]|nr:hypothetical protein RIVM261_024810 [Rivularia sp. IAM M-261]